jgi:hypothetical protein
MEDDGIFAVEKLQGTIVNAVEQNSVTRILYTLICSEYELGLSMESGNLKGRSAALLAAGLDADVSEHVGPDK